MPQTAKPSPFLPYLVAICLAVVVFALHQFQWMNFHELESVDLRFSLRGVKPVPQDVVIVEIDEASLQSLGAWPWPRKTHTEFLQALEKFKPRFVIYNILFTQDSSIEEENRELATAMEKVGKVILPFYYYSEKPFRAFFPTHVLQESTRSTGFANLSADRDGKIRRLKLSVRSDEDVFYPISVLAAMSQFVDEEKSRRWITQIPTDSRNHFWINEADVSSLEKVSFSRVLQASQSGEESLLRKIFENRGVLVGKVESETMIQAKALHTLMSGIYLHPTHRIFDLCLILFLAIVACWSAKIASPGFGIFSILALMGSYALLNILAFNFWGWILPFFVPLIVMGSIYILVLFMEALDIRFRGELIDREIGTAARIQETFLPRSIPSVENLDIDVECRFARQVGGDFYDWTDFGNGNFGICVGDVSGKGIPAAIYMARAISDFRRENKSGLETGELCRLLNTILTREMAASSGMFLTMIYVVVNPHQRKLWVTNAAHMPMIFYSQKQKKSEIFLANKVPVGKPLGLFAEADYQTIELSFEPGDYFVLISDGIKEARNEKSREFGLDRIKKLMEEFAGVPSEELINQLFYSLAAFQKGLPLHDDCTAICVRFRAGF
ncbi:MAG: SpoIIE family protein phosphatase [Candidatus Omnitrophica bacterium]|nr:SpoIIE family protein phosphatase [Candidatus Omnitrophota bacterium]